MECLPSILKMRSFGQQRKLNLYRLTVSTESDSVSLVIGLREVIFDTKKGLLVNGVSTKLKGVCLHQEAGCLGTAVTKEIWRERLTI